MSMMVGARLNIQPAPIGLVIERRIAKVWIGTYINFEKLGRTVLEHRLQQRAMQQSVARPWI